MDMQARADPVEFGVEPGQVRNAGEPRSESRDEMIEVIEAAWLDLVVFGDFHEIIVVGKIGSGVRFAGRHEVALIPGGLSPVREVARD